MFEKILSLVKTDEDYVMAFGSLKDISKLVFKIGTASG